MSRSARKPLGLRRRFAVLQAGGFRCHYCGRGRVDGAVLEVDHVVPVSAGGTNDPSNLVVACSRCNNGKRDEPLRRARCLDEQHPGPFELTPLKPPDPHPLVHVLVCDRCGFIVGQIDDSGPFVVTTERVDRPWRSELSA